MKVKRICKTCGKEFFIYQYKIDKGSGKYCSKECYGMSRRGYRPGWKSKKIKRVCLKCEKEFFVKPSIINRGGGKYCSKICANTALRGKNNVLWKGGKVKCICKECSKEFFVKRAELERGDGKYCSKECVGKAHREENCNLWKGGTSFYPYCPKFNERRKEAVRNFFGRKCLACGADEVEFINRLPVHHVDHDKEQGCDGKPFNLVPLCIKCHGKEIWYEEEYKQYINKTLEEGFKWGIWNREEYIRKVMYPDD